MLKSANEQIDKETNIYLLNKFVRVLPFHRSIRFIKEHNMAYHPFSISNLSDLYTFYEIWNDENYQFTDSELEKMRVTLYNLVGVYIELIANNTFFTEWTQQQTVPMEWKIKYPERFAYVTKSLRNTANSIYDAYINIIALAEIKYGKNWKTTSKNAIQQHS